MALSNSREVALTISAETKGEDGVKRLSEQLAEAADRAGEAAPELQALSKEVAALEAQQGAVSTLGALSREVINLGKKLEGANDTIESTAKALESARAASAAAAQAQADAADKLGGARTRYDDLKRAVADARDELATVKAKAAEAGSATGEYAQQISDAEARLKRLRGELSTSKTTVGELSAEHRAAGKAAREAAADERTLSTEYKNTLASTASLNKAFVAKREELGKTRTALEEAGINTRALATEQKRLASDMAVAQGRATSLMSAYTGIGKTSASAGTQAAKGMREAGEAADQVTSKLNGVAKAVGAAFAASQFSGWAKDLAGVADAAAGLEARIGLAVGASGDLQAGLDAVRSSANAAGSDINAVGELYARIASSTQDLGYSQQRVAELTDTINKSFSVSGTSAQAASGAITQLAQAFASGALRGDEFNSVNEAAPRLMEALAAGLGKTRGELRGMAEDGLLTTEVVLRALASQREAIERDFGQLPETIGRATQKLANEWQVFVAELDRTSGASETVANGLSLVAANLDDIAGAAMKAGELVVAGLAVKAAGAMRGLVVAAGTGSVAMNAMTVATTGLAAAGQAATGAMMALGRALPALGAAGLIAGVVMLVAEFFRAKSAAEEADEAVRKMLEEPATNRTAGEIRLIATEAEAARFKLTDVQAQFQDLVAKGGSVADALGKISAAADLSSADGIAKLVTDMQALEQSALATGEQIQTALADRLTKMAGTDLRDFGLQAEMAFSQGQIGAEQLANVLEARAIAAAKKLGTELSLSADGFSEKFRDAAGSIGVLVDSFDLIKEAGVDAAAVLQGTFTNAVKSASNPKELEHLAEVIKRAGENGQLSGEQVSTMLDNIRTKADQVTPGINSVAEALKELGIVSDAALKDTADRFQEAYQAVVKMGGSVREQEAAFTRWAEAAVKANGGVVDASVKAAAAQQRMQVAADESGRVIVKRMGDVYREVLSVKDAADGAAGAFSDMASNAAAAAKEVETIASFKSIVDRPAGETIAGANYSDLVNQAANLGGEAGRQQALAIIQSAARESNRAMVNGNGVAVSEETVRRYLLDLIERLQKATSQKREQTSTSSASTTVHRVEIKLGNRSTAVNVASRSDADALKGFLSELERYQGVSQ